MKNIYSSQVYYKELGVYGSRKLFQYPKLPIYEDLYHNHIYPLLINKGWSDIVRIYICRLPMATN